MILLQRIPPFVKKSSQTAKKDLQKTKMEFEKSFCFIMRTEKNDIPYKNSEQEENRIYSYRAPYSNFNHQDSLLIWKTGSGVGNGEVNSEIFDFSNGVKHSSA